MLASIEAGAAPLAPSLPSDGPASAPLDDTAETTPDTAASANQDLVRRAEAIMLKQRIEDQDREAHLDLVRSEFDYAQQQRAEFQREMNILRDMAMEQRKLDDEILKKWIALI
ncbi:MAG TPA: hypothetical protein VKG44_11625 [Candidatus Baltobacteraceae bacterium]|nr:hypothetical protein [Candidatus Baltobacteraceae bacterium]